MVLEAIMLCIDNSEWSRNGDYAPTRFDAQKETINFLASSKINSNPETTVGLLSLAGDRIEVHISPTRSPGQIMTALAKDVHIGGTSSFVAGLKTAALALKNRQNKNQRQRIILFAGSPLSGEDGKELVKLSKAFKKNNVSVDIINFGTENSTNDNAERWEQFVAGVGGGDANHLVNVPPGPHILSDMVMSSAIMQDDAGGGARPGAAAAGGGGGGGGGGMGGFGDIDPNQDPEMALAIRMSMEEERARQQRLAGETPGAAAAAGGEASAAGAATAAAGGSSDAVPMEDDEEALLQQAIALSMQMNQAGDALEAPSAITPTTTATSATDAAIAGTAVPDPAANSAAAAANVDIDAAMQDEDFLASLVASVTGGTGAADADAMLDQLTGEKKEEKKDEGKDKQ